MARERAFGLGWAAVRERALAAVEADLEQALLAARAVPVQEGPCAWERTRTRLEVVVGSPRGVKWIEQKFFAVDADLDPSLPANRHVLECVTYIPPKGLLVLSIPDAAREGLSQAAKVRVFRGDDANLKIIEARRAALEGSSRGGVLASLWDRKSAVQVSPAPNPGYLPADRRMNDGQLRGLAAMTSPGGSLIWGPPGTGKTTVITSAIVDALRNGRSVLITSHTNVAVDNVLQGMVKDDTAYRLGLVEPGRIVRHGDDQKVLPDIAAHEFLHLDKAAAVLTNLHERREELQSRINANRCHEDRLIEPRLRELLDAGGIDVALLGRAIDAQAELTELAEARRELRQVSEALECASEEHRRTASIYAEHAGSGDRLLEHDAMAMELADTHAQGAADLHKLREQEHTLEIAVQIASSSMRSAEIALEAGWLRLVPALRRRRQAALENAFRVERTATIELAKTRDQVDRGEKTLAYLAERLAAGTQQRGVLLLSAHAEKVAAESTNAAAGTVSEIEGRRVALEGRIADLEEAVGALEAQSSLIDAAILDGSMERVIEYRDALERISVLDGLLSDSKLELEALESEYQQTKQNLLATAPVLACTLTALTFNSALLKRRFDVVIIDEAASAQAAAVVYAGSRADHTLAVVGDFLQNAPINEIEDPRDEHESQIAQWRTADLFDLVGITDRYSAEAHPRCIALSTQYRYPQIIADAVNGFCYDDLLETGKADVDHAGAVVTFIDTSKIRGLEFRRAGESWSCEATAFIAVEYAKQFTPDVGFVTPYAGQAKLVTSIARTHGLSLQAGTAHKFQGQEYGTVIFDLMQDGKPRWIAHASLRGGSRAISAAKLLNVALTRMKEQIFLIGNWDFIRAQETPGMQAITALEYNPQFRLLRQ